MLQGLRGIVDHVVSVLVNDGSPDADVADGNAVCRQLDVDPDARDVPAKLESRALEKKTVEATIRVSTPPDKSGVVVSVTPPKSPALGALLLLLEIAAVPLLAFGTDSLSVATLALVRALWLVTLLYWLGDVCQPFLLRQLDDERRTDSPEEAFWDYHSRLSIGFDIVMIILDLVIAIMSLMSDVHNSYIWVLRVVRFARYARVRQRLSLVASVHARRTQWCVVEPAVLIIACFHAFACGFYLVSADNQHEPDAWVPQHNPKSARDAYMLALHWSMSQFTPVTSEVQPGSQMERYYAAGAAFVAAVLLSVFFGNLMAAATEAAGARQRHKSCMAATREYLDDCGARRALHRRFAAWLAAESPPNNASLSAPSTEHQKLPGWVAIRLKRSDPALSAELDELIRKPAIVGHPLFRQLQDAHKKLAPGIYLRLEELTLAPGEVLYSAGKPGTRAHIVVNGRLRYEALPYDRTSGSDEPATLMKGQWLGEAALWFHMWVRRGRPYACSAGWSHCHLVSLPAQQLQELLLEPQHREAHAMVAAYARSFGQYAMEQSQSWLTDHIDEDSASEIFKRSRAEMDELSE